MREDWHVPGFTFLIYMRDIMTGSTASGIGDYASKSKASVAVGSRRKLKNPLAALPTFAHKALAALHKAGHLKHWVQQNHGHTVFKVVVIGLGIRLPHNVTIFAVSR